jgi:hypothetical protein
MAEPLTDAVLSHVDKGDWLKALIVVMGIAIVFLWRQNQWLLQQLLTISNETTKVLEGLKNKLKDKDD